MSRASFASASHARHGMIRQISARNWTSQFLAARSAELRHSKVTVVIIFSASVELIGAINVALARSQAEINAMHIWQKFIKVLLNKKNY
mgnify:CR=1 FL=1